MPGIAFLHFSCGSLCIKAFRTINTRLHVQTTNKPDDQEFNVLFVAAFNFRAANQRTEKKSIQPSQEEVHNQATLFLSLKSAS
jgi:hypothetical protein